LLSGMPSALATPLSVSRIGFHAGADVAELNLHRCVADRTGGVSDCIETPPLYAANSLRERLKIRQFVAVIAS
jgi:hypothetical protein